MCSPQPGQLYNACFSKPAVMAILIAVVAVIIGLIISYLIFKVKQKTVSHYTLLAFSLSSIVSSPIIGILVIMSPNPDFTMSTLRLLVIVNGLMMLFWYGFLIDFLKIKKRFLLAFSSIVLISMSVYLIIFPYSIVDRIVWNDGIGWYDFIFKDNIILSLLPFVPLFFPHITGLFYLVAAYHQTGSPIQRNRIKYLALASGIFMCGWILYLAPIQEYRSFPFDAIAAAVSGALLTYAVVKFKLLDISVIIRKGLLYTLLTTTVTGLYLLFAFAVQTLTNSPAQPASLASAITTSIFVAFVFQPLRNHTQALIDKLFFRKSYSTQKLVAQFSKVTSSTIERDELTSSVIELISNTIQIGHAFLLLSEENSNQYSLAYAKAYKNTGNLVLESTHPLISLLKTNKEPLDFYDNNDLQNIGWLEERDVEIVIPLITKASLVGLICLGPKLSEQKFTIEEYALLEVLASQAAIAFENSALLETVRSEKKQVEKALRQEKELDRQKSEFISIASQNLRTPLTVASGYVDLMLGGQNGRPQEDRDSLNSIRESLKSLSVITEQLLLISQAEAKIKIYRFKTENYLDLIERVIKLYTPQAVAKSLTIHYERPDVKNSFAVVDRSCLELAIGNLIDNAIKFTEAGSIRVDVGEGENEIEIKITDSGKGIPPENIPNLFSKFYQVNNNQYNYIPGMGSGLYVTKLVVEAHKGSVHVESTVDKGSVFSITIPANLKPTVSESAVKAPLS